MLRQPATNASYFVDLVGIPATEWFLFDCVTDSSDAWSAKSDGGHMKPLIPTLSMQVTYQCNIECKHCGPFCGPREHDWMSEAEMKDLIMQASNLGAYNVVFTGGEPSLLKDILVRLLRFIKADTRIKSTRIVTNAKWANTYEKALRVLREWQDAGLDELNVSCGEYHQEFVPISSVVNAYKAGSELRYKTVLLCGEFLSEEVGKLSPRDFQEALGEALPSTMERSPFQSRCHGMQRTQAMPYGRGRDFVPLDGLRFSPEREIESRCADILSAITVHPNGNTTACCGIMVRKESLLNIGNWRSEKLESIMTKARQDIVLNWIRYLGLRDMKQWLKEKDPSLHFRDTYLNICDLCAEIVYNDRCQELLNAFASQRVADVIVNKLAMDATVFGMDQFNYASDKPRA